MLSRHRLVSVLAVRASLVVKVNCLVYGVFAEDRVVTLDGSQTVGVTFWIMIILQTIGSVDIRGPRKMPAPKQYLAIFAAWGVLQIIADTGRDRIARAGAWLFLVTAMVLGPFGAKLVSLFSTVASSYGVTPASTAPTPTSPSQGTVNA